MWGKGGIAVLLIVQAGLVFAQRSGTLRLKLDPAATVYRVDHKFTLARPEVELLEGPHHFSFWAPQRRMVDTTLTISSDRTAEFTLRLPFSTEYLMYQRDLNAWTKERRLVRLLPTAATGAALVWTAIAYGGMKKAHDRLDEDRTAYEQAGSPHAIMVLKERTMPAHKDDLRRANTRFQVAAGVTLLCAGATAWLYLRSARKPKPVFQDKEKLRFDGLSWMPGPQGGAWQGGFTWNFTE